MGVCQSIGFSIACALFGVLDWERVPAFQWRDGQGRVTDYAIVARDPYPLVEASPRMVAIWAGWKWTLKVNAMVLGPAAEYANAVSFDRVVVTVNPPPIVPTDCERCGP